MVRTPPDLVRPAASSGTLPGIVTSDSDLIAARGDAAAARVSLNLLLGQPADAPLALADSLNDGALVTAEAATAMASSSNTELQVLDRRIEEQRMKVALAKAMIT